MNLSKYLSGVVFVDVETTGGKAESDRVFEVGIVRVENRQIVQKYQALINPQKSIHWAIKKKTGVKKEDVAEEPVFADLAEKIYSLIQNSLLVAHNAKFDYSFLQQEFLRVGKSLQVDRLCTMKLSKSLYPKIGKYGLEHLCGHFEIKAERHHRALEDAMSAYLLCQRMKEEVESKKFAEAMKRSIET